MISKSKEFHPPGPNASSYLLMLTLLLQSWEAPCVCNSPWPSPWALPCCLPCLHADLLHSSSPRVTLPRISVTFHRLRNILLHNFISCNWSIDYIWNIYSALSLHILYNWGLDWYSTKPPTPQGMSGGGTEESRDQRMPGAANSYRNFRMRNGKWEILHWSSVD